MYANKDFSKTVKIFSKDQLIFKFSSYIAAHKLCKIIQSPFFPDNRDAEN